MADRDLFEEQDESPKQDTELIKKYKELESKLSGLQDEMSRSSKSWQEERTKLEETIKDASAKASVADNWDKIINENPMAATKMIMDYALGKGGQGVARGGSREESDKSREEITKIIGRQDRLEKELQDRATKEYTSSMYTAISEAMDELQEVAGIEANPKGIIEYLQRNGYTYPSQVKDAVYGMYRDQILSSTKKKREKDDTVVMGTSGYPSGIETADESVSDMGKVSSDDLWNTVAGKLFK